MTKNVLALFGSNILGGNTDKLLSAAVKGVEDAGCTVDRINVAHLHAGPCNQTYSCMIEPTCAIEDDMQAAYRKIKQADGLIIATPVMTYGIPGALKCFMDRCQPFYMAKYYRKQPFITPEHAKVRRTLFLCIGGMNTPDVFTGPVLTTKAFCAIVDAKYADELLQNDMDTIINLDNKPEVLAEAYEKGKALGERILKLRDGVEVPAILDYVVSVSRIRSS